MSESYHIRLAKEQFVFCAAHFITFNGNVCERLHGHNYRVTADIHGPLDENQYVVDFIAARDALLKITTALDHHVLLPTEHPLIAVTEQAGEGCPEVIARFEQRRWVFPREDCVLLPVANTTAELLARYIGLQLEEALHAAGHTALTELVISVDECDGQQGIWGKNLDSHPSL